MSNFNQKCYYNQIIDKVPVQNFANAQKSCEDKNSNLVVIKSDEEFNALGELYGILKAFTWIGLKYQDDAVPYKWKWLDGTEINSTNKWWCPGSPANTGKNIVWGKGNNCAAIRMRSEFGAQYSGICIFDYPCYFTFRYTCEASNSSAVTLPKSTQTKAPLTTVAPAKCSSPFMSLLTYNAKCFYNTTFDRQPLATYEQAKKICADNFTASLPIVDTTEKLNSMAELAPKIKYFFWVKITKIAFK